jgi:acetyl-CoA carboxylase carboxyltransferase component
LTGPRAGAGAAAGVAAARVTEATVLRSSLDTGSPEYLANTEAQLALLGELAAELEAARAGGGPRYAQRHRDRGRLLARERIELLLDRDAPFLELSALAAWGTEFTVGASLVTGIGVVSGVECVLIAHDPTVRGGAMNPYSLRKSLRALEIARRNRLPVINLVESGGADLPTQSDLFVPAGKIFHDLTELSAMGVPTIALVFGNSTAGGAYVPGMCDYSVLVDGQAKVFLGGPPLVRMATGEDADDEELGGARMHSRVSGLADYFATDERDAIRLGRRIVSELNWRKLGPGPALPADGPVHDPQDLLGIAPADIRVPFDPREVLARVLDGSRFGEYKESYGTSLVTGWASVHGYPVGVLANARGVLFSEEAKKAAEFIQLANQTDTPLIFLQNTTGYMVGTSYEQGGIIKDGAKMINAVTNSTVPHITLNMAASFGAGNYGMSGRAYDPRLLFAWPGAKLAVMGATQLAGVMSIVGRAAAQSAGRPFDETADTHRRAAIEAQIERESHAFFVTARLYDDGLIDPRDTRTVLGIALSAACSAPVEGRRGFGVFRM